MRCFAACPDFVPGVAEEFDVGANFVVGRAAGSGAHDEAAGKGAARFADEAAKARAVFGGDDVARHADVIDGGHVDQEAAGQRDVAGDARALFAERFLGDLNDDFLPGLQHFGNQLRTARRTGMAALMTTIRGAGRHRGGVRNAVRRAERAAIGTPPRLSGRPPRLSDAAAIIAAASRPPLRNGRWKRERGLPPMRAESRGKSSRGADGPPTRGARVSPGRRITSSSRYVSDAGSAEDSPERS